MSKETAVRAVLKKILSSTVLENLQPVSNLLFLGKVPEYVAPSQIQGLVEETDFWASLNLSLNQDLEQRLLGLC